MHGSSSPSSSGSGGWKFFKDFMAGGIAGSIAKTIAAPI
jgi:hypothetical protein